MRTVFDIPENTVEEETRQNVVEIKDDTTNIQDQLLILMDAVAELYETIAGGEQ